MRYTRSRNLLRLAGHDQQIGLSRPGWFCLPNMAAAAGQQDHARASLAHSIYGNQFFERGADTLFGALFAAYSQTPGMLIETGPVLGPKKGLALVDGHAGEDAAAIEHRGGHGRDAGLGGLEHALVEVDDRMHSALSGYALFHGRCHSFRRAALFPSDVLQTFSRSAMPAATTFSPLAATRNCSPLTRPRTVKGELVREAISAIAWSERSSKLMMMREGDSLNSRLISESVPWRSTSAPIAAVLRDEKQHSARATARPPSEQS